MVRVVVMMAVLALAAPAAAQTWDPECDPASRVEYGGGNPYNVTERPIRLCLPLLGSRGDPVAPDFYGEVAVEINGILAVSVSDETVHPGGYVTITVPEQLEEDGELRVWASNVEGTTGEVAGPFPARFPAAPLQSPLAPILVLN